MQSTPFSGYSDPLVGQVLSGGLQLVERLGGTKEQPLYRAQYSQTGPPFAVQFLQSLRPPQDPSANLPPATRLWQQLRRACQIRHRNVATLLEVSRTPDGAVYVVSELLSGQLLSEVLSARGTLPLPEGVQICLQAAVGLQAAHQVGVAHGRISPSAILLTSDDDGGLLVKLVGFDFSWYGAYPEQALAPPLEDQYSSPERLAGSAPDEVSDVFSLGAVLYHVLTGALPGNDHVPRSIPVATRRVLERALAPADQRYPTVGAFAEALTQAAAPAMRHQPARWRSGWLAASVALLFVAASLAWGWERIRPDLERIPHILKTGASALTPAAISRADSVTTEPRKQPVETGVVRRSLADSTAKPSQASELQDTNRGPYISPFRRAHPWAAQPKGGTYFPSSCPLALQSSELVYFRTEQEARATGRSRSKEPGCS